MSFLAGAAATWPSTQHNRAQTAEVMISHSGTRRNTGIFSGGCRVGQAGGASACEQNHDQKAVIPVYLYLGAHNVYYVKLPAKVLYFMNQDGSHKIIGLSPLHIFRKFKK